MGDDVVGQFVIGSEIGKGSFAQVYSGKHKVCNPHHPSVLIPRDGSCTQFWDLLRWID